jgi:hypothetical protein
LQFNYSKKIIILKEIYNQFKMAGNTQIMTYDPLEAYLNQTWRPAVSYIGASHFPPTNIAGNVLRPESSIKISMRTPPNFDSFKKV